jgi:hypothetical protein
VFREANKAAAAVHWQKFSGKFKVETEILQLITLFTKADKWQNRD